MERRGRVNQAKDYFLLWCISLMDTPYGPFKGGVFPLRSVIDVVHVSYSRRRNRRIATFRVMTLRVPPLRVLVRPEAFV